MGYVAHDAVIVTMWRDLDGHPDMGAFLSSMPDEYRLLVRGPFQGVVNSYETWVFLPDGSLEYRDESDAADEWRQRFIALWPAGRASLVHVRFGGSYGRDQRATVEHETAGP
jgi:hypothetical protein